VSGSSKISTFFFGVGVLITLTGDFLLLFRGESGNLGSDISI